MCSDKDSSVDPNKQDFFVKFLFSTLYQLFRVDSFFFNKAATVVVTYPKIVDKLMKEFLGSEASYFSFE